MDTALPKSGKTPNEKNAVTGRIFFLDLGGGRVLSANPDGSDLKTIVVEKTFPELRELMNSHAIDPLRAFSEICRAELQALKAP
jgi:hypothetical protein